MFKILYKKQKNLGYYEFTKFHTNDIDVIYIINHDINEMKLIGNRSEVLWAWGYTDLTH